MTVLQTCSALAVLTSGWAVWVRRLSFGSRWDRPLTAGVALYCVASALDGPWPAIAAASFPLTGKYYLLNTAGHICFLAGTAAGAKAVCLRLLTDDDLDRLMKTRVLPIVGIATIIMLICILATPMTATMPADYLYGVPLDGWLRVYFATFFLTLTAILWLALFGGWRLSGQAPRAEPALPLLATTSTGSLACLSFLGLLLTGRSELIPTVWPVAYLATTAASLTCAFAWRHRMAQLMRPAKD